MFFIRLPNPVSFAIVPALFRSKIRSQAEEAQASRRPKRVHMADEWVVSAISRARRGSSVVERRTENPCVASSILALGTTTDAFWVTGTRRAKKNPETFFSGFFVISNKMETYPQLLRIGLHKKDRARSRLLEVSDGAVESVAVHVTQIADDIDVPRPRVAHIIEGRHA